MKRIDHHETRHHRLRLTRPGSPRVVTVQSNLCQHFGPLQPLGLADSVLRSDEGVFDETWSCSRMPTPAKPPGS